MPDEQQLTEYVEQALEAVKAAWAIIAEFVESVMDTCRKVYAWAQERYQEAGAPYGLTADGMLRWWQERLTIARLRQEADRLEAHHQMLAGLRSG